MINAKKRIKIARKWQKLVAMNQKRLTLSRAVSSQNSYCCNTSPMAINGHFVVYSADQRRFALPLAYLNNDVYRELFRMAEEEFGLPNNGPITLPCDAMFMEYVIALVQKHAAKDLERALFTSITSGSCLSSSCCHLEQANKQLLICGF